jgi:hypothetical protein
MRKWRSYNFLLVLLSTNSHENCCRDSGCLSRFLHSLLKIQASGHLCCMKNSSESQVDNNVALNLRNLKHTQLMFRLSHPIFLCHERDADLKSVFLFAAISETSESRMFHDGEYQKYLLLECDALSFDKHLLFCHEEGGRRFLRNVRIYLPRIYGITSDTSTIFLSSYHILTLHYTNFHHFENWMQNIHKIWWVFESVTFS